jgi:hypothetical protein
VVARGVGCCPVVVVVVAARGGLWGRRRRHGRAPGGATRGGAKGIESLLGSSHGRSISESGRTPCWR